MRGTVVNPAWRGTVTSLFKLVAAVSLETDEWIIPNNEVWEISNFNGFAAGSVDTCVKVIWDYSGTQVVLFATHSDGRHTVIETVTGNGTKKLAIVLDNDSSQGETLGCVYEKKRVL